jgi:hypothetical protein
VVVIEAWPISSRILTTSAPDAGRRVQNDICRKSWNVKSSMPAARIVEVNECFTFVIAFPILDKDAERANKP